MTIQNKDEEQTVDAIVTEETAPEDKPKRRGRAARRRRRAENTLATAEPAAAAKAPDTVEVRKKDAPTPGRRQKERIGIIGRFTRPLTNYFRETMVELRKVDWPTRKDAVRLSGIVLAMTAISALVLGFYNFLLDIGLSAVLSIF